MVVEKRENNRDQKRGKAKGNIVNRKYIITYQKSVQIFW